MCESGDRVMQALGTKLFLFYFCRMPQGQAVLNSNGTKKEMRKVNTMPFMLHINKTLNMYALCQGISTIPERIERKIF